MMTITAMDMKIMVTGMKTMGMATIVMQAMTVMEATTLVTISQSMTFLTLVCAVTSG